MEQENKEEKATFEMGNLYDVNKNLVLQNEKELNEGQLNSKIIIVKDFIKKTDNNYYMLLCNERKDYTVFDFKKRNFEERYLDCANCLVNECLANRGEIRGIDVTSDKMAIEIWLVIDNEAYCYYFFPYDNGVINDF